MLHLLYFIPIDAVYFFLLSASISSEIATSLSSILSSLILSILVIITVRILLSADLLIGLSIGLFSFCSITLVAILFAGRLLNLHFHVS